VNKSRLFIDNEKQEGSAVADKPAWRESLPKIVPIRRAGHPRSSILVSIESPCTTSY